MMALLTMGFAACNDDFPTEFVPQTNAPESAFPANAVSVTPSASTINLVDLLAAEVEQPIAIGTINLASPLPANTEMKAEVQISRNEDFSQFVTVDANVNEKNVITVMPSALSNAYYGSITKNPAATNLYMRTLLYTVTGGDAVTIVGKPGENYYGTQKVAFTPENRANISSAYYLIGGPNDWQASAVERMIKFNHSGADVYEDPIFTVIFDANAGGDTWFAIGDDTACDAIGNGDWTKLLGIVGGNSQATEGQLDFRYNMGADNSFCVPAGPKKIKVTLNMLEYTFKVESVNIAEAYYLIGGPGEWGAESAMTMKFSHSSASVIDDPVFTYVFAGNGSDMWFAFGDEEAINAVAEGTWNKLFGTTGASEDLSGSFDRRYNLDGDHSFHVDGQAKFYRFQVNMAEMTYTITTLNFDPFVYFIGATDGWANAEQKLALTDESGIYTGYLYVADPNGWGVEFKFQKEPGNWDTQLNSNNLSEISGGFAKGGDNIVAAEGEGVYYVTLDMANLTLNALKVEKMGIIGDFNGWGGDVEMTWNAADYCYEATNAGVNANGWKFRVNSDWGINLGGETLDNLVANGANIGVAGQTIKLYPTRRTSDNIYCTVE